MIQVREQYGNIYVRILDTAHTFEHTMEKVLKVPQRCFKQNTGEWMFPKESLHHLLQQFGNQIVWMQPLQEIVKNIGLEDPLVQKHIDWSNNDDFSHWVIPPYPYQKVGSHFLADRERAAIFDGVGLGKTPMILGASDLLFQKKGAKRALIVTLNSLKRQWAKEVNKFMGEEAIAVYGTAAKRKKLIKGFNSRNDIRFMIVNYEMLRQKQYMDLILECDFDIAALDEAQKIKSGVEDKMLDIKPSQNAKGAYLLKEHIPYRFIATATPIQSKAEEIWSLYHFVDPNILGSWEYFRERYCSYHPRFGINGYYNEGELFYKIAPHFIRRTKEMPEIQQQLPKVKHDHIFMDQTEGQIALEDYLLTKIETLKEEAKKVGPNGIVINGQLFNREQADEYFDGLSQGYTSFLLAINDTPELLSMSESQLAHQTLNEAGVSQKEMKKSPKIDHLLDFYNQLMFDEPNSKVVIFTKFERMAQVLHRNLPGSLVYTGQMSDREKDMAVTQFRENQNAKIFIATDAGSTGLNLQVANYLIHVDLPWDPTLIEQRNGRIDRTGNPHPNITIMYYIMSDSYEENLLELLDKKGDMASSILEGGQMKKANQNFNKLAINRMLKNKDKKFATN